MSHLYLPLTCHPSLYHIGLLLPPFPSKSGLHSELIMRSNEREIKTKNALYVKQQLMMYLRNGCCLFLFYRHQLVADCYNCEGTSPSASGNEIMETLLDFILRAFQLYKDLSAFPELFSSLIANLSKFVLIQLSIQEIVNCIDYCHYRVAATAGWPVLLKEKMESAINTYKVMAARPRLVLTMLKQKPKSINFYEPKFDAV